MISAMYWPSREARMSPLGRVHRIRPVDNWTTQNWTACPLLVPCVTTARSFSMEHASTPEEAWSYMRATWATFLGACPTAVSCRVAGSPPAGGNLDLETMLQ